GGGVRHHRPVLRCRSAGDRRGGLALGAAIGRALARRDQLPAAADRAPVRPGHPGQRCHREPVLRADAAARRVPRLGGRLDGSRAGVGVAVARAARSLTPTVRSARASATDDDYHRSMSNAPTATAAAPTASTPDDRPYSPGLEGVIAGETSLSKVD